MEYVYLIPPILGAFIGYLTNVIAVELLFRPKKPINLFEIKIQGIVPARSKEILERFIESLSEILTQEDFEFMLDKAISRSYVESQVIKKVDEIFNKAPFSIFKNKLLRSISVSLSDTIIQALKNTASKSIAKNIDLREFVINKAQKISNEEIESIFKKFTKKELRFIELSGAALGFVIGALQSLIMFLC